MSGKTEALKRAFRAELHNALHEKMGPEWTSIAVLAEGRKVTVQKRSSGMVHFIKFTLREDLHSVEVVLAAAREAETTFPTVWWADRSLHRTAPGYRTVLADRGQSYSEKRFPIPKEWWQDQRLTQAIHAMVAEVCVRAEDWFQQARSLLVQPLT